MSCRGETQTCSADRPHPFWLRLSTSNGWSSTEQRVRGQPRKPSKPRGVRSGEVRRAPATVRMDRARQARRQGMTLLGHALRRVKSSVYSADQERVLDVIADCGNASSCFAPGTSAQCSTIRVDGPGRRCRRQRGDGVVVGAPADQRARPPTLAHSRRTRVRDHRVDRTHLQPPMSPASPRQTHPGSNSNSHLPAPLKQHDHQ